MKNKLLKLTKELIQIPSTADNPTAIQEIIDYMKEYLSEFTVERFTQNNKPSLLIYTGETRPEKFRLILNGHLDVVPATDKEFKPKEVENKLLGRGSYDMKSGVAIIIELFKEYANKVDYPLGLQLVTDEEIGGFNGTLHQLEQGVRTDFVIATEPTNLHIKHKAKGVLWIKIQTEGTPAHGAYPWKGKNPISSLAKFLTNLETRFPNPLEAAWETTITPTTIGTTNQSSNTSPKDAYVNLDIRFIPEDRELIEREIRKLLPDNCEMTIIFDEPAHIMKTINPDLQLLSRIIKEKLKITKPLISGHGASDLRHYSKHQIPGIEFGPVGGEHHTEKEWLDVDSLESAYGVLKEFILSI